MTISERAKSMKEVLGLAAIVIAALFWIFQVDATANEAVKADEKIIEKVDQNTAAVIELAVKAAISDTKNVEITRRLNSIEDKLDQALDKK